MTRWWPGYEGLYRADDPKCMFCDLPALHDHYTCGQASCDELKARDRQNEAWRRGRAGG